MRHRDFFPWVVVVKSTQFTLFGPLPPERRHFALKKDAKRFVNQLHRTDPTAVCDVRCGPKYYEPR